MKRRIILLGLGAAMLIGAFFAGAFFQNAKNGYHFRVLKEENYESAVGPIKWTCFTETVGFPFLDPEKTMITIGNRTIYKAQRDFQEDSPSARNIKASGNSITWDDGDDLYQLTITPIQVGGTNKAANASH